MREGFLKTLKKWLREEVESGFYDEEDKDVFLQSIEKLKSMSDEKISQIKADIYIFIDEGPEKYIDYCIEKKQFGEIEKLAANHFDDTNVYDSLQTYLEEHPDETADKFDEDAFANWRWQNDDEFVDAMKEAAQEGYRANDSWMDELDRRAMEQTALDYDLHWGIIKCIRSEW